MQEQIVEPVASTKARPQEYHQKIHDQLKEGIIEHALPANEATNAFHYLPHHPVVRRDKTTSKVRIVYDTSAKSPNLSSLNKCLQRGPPFEQLMFDIIVMFLVTQDSPHSWFRKSIFDDFRQRRRLRHLKVSLGGWCFKGITWNQDVQVHLFDIWGIFRPISFECHSTISSKEEHEGSWSACSPLCLFHICWWQSREPKQTKKHSDCTSGLRPSSEKEGSTCGSYEQTQEHSERG